MNNFARLCYAWGMTSKLFFVILAVSLLINCRSAAHRRGEFDEVLLKTLAPVPSTVLIADDPQAQKEIMLAFASAYPDKIGSVELLDNDWTMLVNDRRFFYANGRFLPEELRGQWEDYQPYDFYVYPWVGTEAHRQAAFRYPVYSTGSSFLFDTLYFSPTEDNSWDMQVKYSFLGVKMLVHSYIEPFLDSVSRQIRAAAEIDPSIDQWIAELRTAPPSFGWNWRTIAGTHRRSNHSYGTALDLLPKNLGGRYTYWQWNLNDTAKGNSGVEYYLPPRAVIQAFEDHGFIWGGSWDLIDTMHFEYRPEIFILNNRRITAADQAINE